MAEELKIKLGADVSEVITAVDEVGKRFKQFGYTVESVGGNGFPSLYDNMRKVSKQAKEFGYTIEGIGKRSFPSLYDNASKVSRGVGGVGDALTKASKIAGTTNQSFVNLSRVVSDAPFGFIAIQNNLEPLLQSFQQLRVQTGSTSAAVQSFLGGFLGAGGILFAFSAVSSLTTTLIQKYGSLGNAFNSLLSNTEQLTDAQKKIAEGVADEFAQVTLLVNLYPQLEGRRKEQDKLLKKLNEAAPSYFKTLNSEKVTVEQLTTAYDKYAKSLLGKIFIESQQERLREAAKKYAEDLVRLNDAQVKGANQREKDSKKISNEVALLDRLGKAQQNLRGDIAIGVQPVATKKSFDEAFQDILNNFNKQAQAILSGTSSIVEKLDFNSIFEDKAVKDIKIVPDIDVPGSLQALTNQTRDFGSAFSDQVFRDIQSEIDKAKVRGGVKITPSIDVQNQIAGLEVIRNQTANTAAAFNELLAPAISTVFGALENGQSIPKALGQAFKSLLVQLTLTVVKAAALAAILSALPGGAALAGGGTLKGFGAIFSALLGVGKGSVSNPSFGGLGAGSLGLQGGVALQVRGTDLVGVLNGANARIGRVG